MDIPIFDLLHEQLRRRAQAIDGCPKDGFVFPAQAAKYQQKLDSITLRVKRILAGALSEPEAQALPEVSQNEAHSHGLAYIAACTNARKRERMQRVFELYMEGKTTTEVADATGDSKGSVSHYLNEIEGAIGCRIIRGRTSDLHPTAWARRKPGFLREQRKEGVRDASIRDFHNFRVTWVTLALSAGMPLELVRKVTGHQTTDVVLQHYFHLGRELLRRAIQTAMPQLLTDGARSPRDEMREIIEWMTPRTMKRDKARLLELLNTA